MAFKDLYDFAQTLSPKVSRKSIRKAVLDLSGIDRVSHVKCKMDRTISRGYYLSPTNKEDRIFKDLGGHIIVTAHDMNYCWERFVYTKELMHLLGNIHGATDTGEQFEALLNEFSTANDDASPQMTSELHCFWMALAVLCPEARRIEYEVAKAKGAIDDMGIAESLKIPYQYVPRLFEKRFASTIKVLLSE